AGRVPHQLRREQWRDRWATYTARRELRHSIRLAHHGGELTLSRRGPFEQPLLGGACVGPRKRREQYGIVARYPDQRSPEARRHADLGEHIPRVTPADQALLAEIVNCDISTRGGQ